MSLNESIIEDAALEWFGELGYAVGHARWNRNGEEIAEGKWTKSIRLVRCCWWDALREAIRWQNPALNGGKIEPKLETIA